MSGQADNSFGAYVVKSVKPVSDVLDRFPQTVQAVEARRLCYCLWSDEAEEWRTPADGIDQLVDIQLSIVPVYLMNAYKKYLRVSLATTPSLS